MFSTRGTISTTSSRSAATEVMVRQGGGADEDRHDWRASEPCPGVGIKASKEDSRAGRAGRSDLGDHRSGGAPTVTPSCCWLTRSTGRLRTSAPSTSTWRWSTFRLEQHPRQRDRRRGGAAAMARRWTMNPAGGQIGGNAGERPPQVADLDVAEVGLEPMVHQPAAGHRQERHQAMSASRAGIDEGSRMRRLSSSFHPAQGQAGGDDRAHRGAGQEVDRRLKFAQRPGHPHMGVGPGARRTAQGPTELPV